MGPCGPLHNDPTIHGGRAKEIGKQRQTSSYQRTIATSYVRYLQTHQSKTLSKNEYDKVLESHLFLKQKRDQSIKGRMVACGNKQIGHINKTHATSPAAALESVLLTSTIDAKEGRDVEIIDIPNAFFITRIKN